MESFVLFLYLTIYSGVQCTTNGYINGSSPTPITNVLKRPNLKVPETNSTTDNQPDPNGGNKTTSYGPEITTVHILINNAGSENVTTDLNDTAAFFNYSYIFASCEYMIPSLLIIYTTLSVAGLVVILNFVVMCIFLQKKNRSPLTILLSCLAFSDALTAIMFSVNHLIVIHSGDVQSFGDSTMWAPGYQGLVIAFLYSPILAVMFHHISVLLTAVLSLQKALSMVFPIWIRIHLNEKAAILTSLCVAIFSILSHLPVAVGYLYAFSAQPVTACPDFHDSHYFFIATSIAASCTYVLCITVVFVCTSIVCCKLTCFRGTVQGIHTPSVQKRNQRSATIVVSICIIFIISEVIPFFGWCLITFGRFFPSEALFVFEVVRQYNILSQLIGFLLNFIVYITMGRHLRNILVTRFRHKCMKCSSCK